MSSPESRALAFEGLSSDERQRLDIAVEQMVEAFKALNDLRGPLYTAAFLIALGRKWEKDFGQ